MSKAVFLFAAILLFACNNDKKTPGEKELTMSEKLVGEWNNISIKVDIQSQNNSDSNNVFEAKRGEWETVVKIKPIRTFFTADSNYHSAHYKLNDSLFYDPAGKWWLEGDSLVMKQESPFPELSKFLLTLKGDTASFKGLVDWDTDGKKDDIYFGEQVRK